MQKQDQGRGSAAGGQAASKGQAGQKTQLKRAISRRPYAVQRAALAPGGGALAPGGPVERSTSVHQAAASGTQGSGGALPHLDAIQASFGRHDVSAVQAHTGSAADAACESMGASAYATGNAVAFKGAPDLHTAAHEAAHIVQQRGGVSLKGGVGQVGDRYEQHADAVADRVVQGRSAEGLLDTMTGPGGGSGGVQALQLHPDVVHVERSRMRLQNFGQGDAALLEDHQWAILEELAPSLRVWARELGSDPAYAPALIDAVFGFASPEGEAEDNEALSQDRADAVVDFLFDAFGDRAEAAPPAPRGLGERSIDQNADESEYPRLRAVEILVARADLPPARQDSPDTDDPTPEPNAPLDDLDPSSVAPDLDDPSAVGPIMGTAGGAARALAVGASGTAAGLIAGLGLVGLGFTVWGMLRGWADVVATGYGRTHDHGVVYGLAYSLGGLPVQSIAARAPFTFSTLGHHDDAGYVEYDEDGDPLRSWFRYDDVWQEGLGDGQEAYQELRSEGIEAETINRLWDRVGGADSGMRYIDFVAEVAVMSRADLIGDAFRSANDRDKIDFMENVYYGMGGHPSAIFGWPEPRTWGRQLMF